jgi:AP-1 complex subunit gamma-1
LILEKVATNTDSTKNVGNAVLYEAVRTIMEIEADNSLRVMAINILGKFVTNRDNNVRYVALTTLAKTSQTANATDSNALQRHRAIIIECLQDSDISIRRRALDLSFYLINSQNIRILTRELLAFLDVCEGDIKGSVAWRLCEIAGRYRPNKRWELDTVIRVLRVAGAYVDQMVINYFVKLVSTGPADLFTYTVKKLYSIVKNEGDKALAQEGLVQASVWCIGEYGDLLLTSSSQTFPDEEEGERSALNYDLNSEVTERDVLDFFESLLRGPYGTPLVKQYSLMTLLKLTARFKDSEVIS